MCKYLKVKLFCCYYADDVDKQLDNIDANEMAEEKSSGDNADGHDENMNEDIEQGNEENGETEEVSTTRVYVCICCCS